MGEMADYYLEQQEWEALNFPHTRLPSRAERRDTFRWKTKEGQVFLLRELSDQHIENIIKYERKKIDTIPPQDYDPIAGNPVDTEREVEHLEGIILVMQEEQKYRKQHHITVKPIESPMKLKEKHVR